MNFRTSILGLVLLGCTSAQAPKSAPLSLTDVRVHQSEARPKLVNIERVGDPRPALSLAFLHNQDAKAGQDWASRVQQRLSAVGIYANSRAFSTGVLLGVSLDATPHGLNPVNALRNAVQATPLTSSASGSSVDGCGVPNQLTPARVVPGHANVVLGVVGDGALLERVTHWYSSAGKWGLGTEPNDVWPSSDAVQSDQGTDSSELFVARRTPLRARSMQAAVAVGHQDSTLSLLAGSFPGRFRLLEAQSNYLPGGACVSVRLQAEEATNPAFAAHAARAVEAELEWVLREQLADEDERLVALEGLTAGEAAARAAWLSAVELVPKGEASSSFVHYRGPGGGTNEFASRWADKPSPRVLPLTIQNEPGQGHVWASLVNKCAVQHEGASTSGHTWAALAAAAELHGEYQRDHQWVKASLDATPSLLAGSTSRKPGASDDVAEALGRSVLLLHRGAFQVAHLRQRLSAALPKTPTWSLALKLATGDHPSWLTQAPTNESLLTLNSASLREALQVFAGGPLQLYALTTAGDAEGQRLAARLNHLLSGLRQRELPCVPPSTRLQQLPPSGEYGLQAPAGTPAVLLYVMDGRFAPDVRLVAQALNGPGGWLERSLPSTAFQARVLASALGSTTTLSALAFVVSAESEEHLTNAVAQVRALVPRLTLANLGLTKPTPPVYELPEERLLHLTRGGAEQEASEDALLRALATAPLIYVKPVPSN